MQKKNVTKLYAPAKAIKKAYALGTASEITFQGYTPFIIHVPHAGLDLLNVRLPSINDLDSEVKLMADLHVDKIADALYRRVPGFLVRNMVSRVQFDPERFDDESEEMNSVGMGIIYSHTHDGMPLYNPPLTPAEVRSRIDAWYPQYAERFEGLVDSTLKRHGRALIIDLHSYATEKLPYELRNGPRPEICLGYDQSNLDPATLEGFRSALSEYELADNTPFAGSYVPLKHFGTNQSVESIMIEIRKDVYLDAETINGSAVDNLAKALANAMISWAERVGYQLVLYPTVEELAAMTDEEASIAIRYAIDHNLAEAPVHGKVGKYQWLKRRRAEFLEESANTGE